ncbi:hypothetical protein AB2T85_06720 [Clostridium butyricum]|uniref:phage tail assembly chaperone n=1 Tax=Clostridium butyricum TaxID=1492 RepID=UPI0034678FB1
MKLTKEILLQNMKTIVDEVTSEKTTDLTIKRLGGEITVKSIDAEKLNSFMSQCDGNAYKANIRIVYSGVIDPSLKDDDLIEKYDCKKDPYEIVKKMFKPIEINLIADKICELSGISAANPQELVAEIKN